jgi:hypothetical protein
LQQFFHCLSAQIYPGLPFREMGKSDSHKITKPYETYKADVYDDGLIADNLPGSASINAAG